MHEREKRERETNPLLRTSLLAVFVVSLAIGVGLGYALDDADADDASFPDRDASDVIATPADFVGDEVSVDGRVGEVFGPRAFSLQDHPTNLGEGVLVVTDEKATTADRSGADRAVLEGDLVQLSGDVREMSAADLEEELGVQLDEEPALLGLADAVPEGESRPVIVAESVEVSPRLFSVQPATSPDAIMQAPDRFYGAVTSVTGEITEVRPSGAFVLDDSLVVLWPLPPLVREKGDRVQVLGPVRRFDPDQFRNDPNLIDDELIEGFAEKPVLVAESIVSAPQSEAAG